ncbi:hypothetical protein BDV93DRAFT_566715 [Ceratobasidium sp. AG-I]|nr:hypothetical protein BDV93DRAFT_566715 [Ceratobasidium sp. AG-I]
MFQHNRMPYRPAPVNGSPTYHSHQLPPPNHNQPAALADSREHRQRLGCGKLVPTLVVFVSTAGLGIGVLAWLFIKRSIPLDEAFQARYILVDEGTKQWGGKMESATLRALTVTSFISKFISITSPVLMSLVAYRVADIWIREQDSPELGRTSGPTPLQYGLMLEVLSASSAMSLWNAVRYIFRGRSGRSKTSYSFSMAVTMGVIVYIVSHLVGLADFWLHSTTSAIRYNVTSTPSELLTSMAFDESLCGESGVSSNMGICLSDEGGFSSQNTHLSDIGQLVVSNSSLDRIAITLADAEDMAVMVPVSVSQFARFKTTSFGIRTKCESLNERCNRESTTAQPDCSNIGITSIPTFYDGVGGIVLVAPYDRWGGAMANVNASSYGISQCCVTNPASSLVQLRWSSGIDGGTTKPNGAVDTYPIPDISIYASCTIEVFNVTLKYDGAAGARVWQLIPEETVSSEERFATSIIAPYSWQLVTERLTTNVQGNAMAVNAAEEVMSVLNQELSRLALGFVSGAFKWIPATDVRFTIPTLVGRYPLIPLFVFVGLLLLYGLIALYLFSISLTVSAGSIIVPAQLRSTPKSKIISVLKLASIRLSSPLSAINQLYSEAPRAETPQDSYHSDARSVKMSATKMFSGSDNPTTGVQRLTIGLEKGTLRPRYGVWKDE